MTDGRMMKTSGCKHGEQTIDISRIQRRKADWHGCAPSLNDELAYTIRVKPEG